MNAARENNKTRQQPLFFNFGSEKLYMPRPPIS